MFFKLLNRKETNNEAEKTTEKKTETTEKKSTTETKSDEKPTEVDSDTAGISFFLKNGNLKKKKNHQKENSNFNQHFLSQIK